MRSFYLSGKDYLLRDDGSVLAWLPHGRIPSIDPQLALQWARLVFERTLVDKHPGHGGLAMARFITEQHILGRYTGENRAYHLSSGALNHLKSIVATW